MDNICSDTNVIYIVSGIFAVTILPIGFTRIKSCCPAFVLIPVYELIGNLFEIHSKDKTYQHDKPNIQLINGVDGTMVNLMLFRK